MKEISVIIPVYKVEPYLNRCIDSVLNQTYTDFETILVDDGSPDHCGEICDEYLLSDERLITIHQPNGGLSAARNTGIDWAFACSDSNWLSFIDSDDWVHEEYLNKLHSSCVNNRLDISACDYIYIKNENVNIQMEGITEIIDIASFWMNKRITATIACGKLYRKNVWRDFRFPVGRIHEDEFTTYKLLFKNDNIGYVKMQLYFYFGRENSISSSIWTPKKIDAIDASSEHLDFFISNYPQVFIREAKIHLGILEKHATESKKNKYFKHHSEIIYRLRKDLKKYRGYEIDHIAYYYHVAYPILGKGDYDKKNVIDRIIKKYHMKRE